MFERPPAIRRNTSRSRSVRSSSCFDGVGCGMRVNCLITRLVIAGERSASPPATVRTAARSCSGGKVRSGPVAHYLFNFVKRDAAKRPALREQAAAFLRVRMWGIGADERHRDALAPGDLVLIYLGAPEREFIGRAELGSAVHDWSPSDAQVYPGDSPSGVLLAHVEEWDPPVPIKTVLSQIDRSGGAKADHEA